MGFTGNAGDVTRLSYRVRLARAFRGLDLEGFAKDTALGYSAFFQVFLTHSALERYVELAGLKSIDSLEEALRPYDPGRVLQDFFRMDKGGKLFDFLHERVNDKLKEKLTKCRDGASSNVGHISAAIRHIFAHGFLTANAYGIDPKRTYQSCKMVSDYLLDFIDDHFVRQVEGYCSRNRISV